jgi:hypothetical protein
LTVAASDNLSIVRTFSPLCRGGITGLALEGVTTLATLAAKSFITSRTSSVANDERENCAKISLANTLADITTSHGRLMLTVLGGLAEFERESYKVSQSTIRCWPEAASLLPWFSRNMPIWNYSVRVASINAFHSATQGDNMLRPVVILAVTTAILLAAPPASNAQTSRGAASISAARQNFSPIQKAACGPYWGRWCGPFTHRVCGPYRCWCAPC